MGKEITSDSFKVQGDLRHATLGGQSFCVYFGPGTIRLGHPALDLPDPIADGAVIGRIFLSATRPTYPWTRMRGPARPKVSVPLLLGSSS